MSSSLKKNQKRFEKNMLLTIILRQQLALLRALCVLVERL